MDIPTTSLVIGGAALAVLLVLAACALLVRAARATRSLAVEVARLREESAALSERLGRLEAGVRTGRADGRTAQDDDYLVPEVLPGTTAATPGAVVPDQLVLSATLGEPLVRAAALGHGVRRALSAESRNRIWFEVRREVRRSRKQRRQDLRAAHRHLRRQPSVDRGEP